MQNFDSSAAVNSDLLQDVSVDECVSLLHELLNDRLLHCSLRVQLFEFVVKTKFEMKIDLFIDIEGIVEKIVLVVS